MTNDLKSPLTRLWHAIPNDLHPLMVRAGLDEAARDLNFEAWRFVGDQLTDGHLTRIEATRLGGASPARISKLVAAGFWREIAGGYELVGYLEVNRTRAQIAKKMADGRKRTARWRGGQQEPPETE